MSWLSKLFGEKKEEVKTEVPVNAPAASEMPASKEPAEEAEEAGSEEMK